MDDESTDESTEQPVFDLLTEMIAGSLERSSLDPVELMLVRIAALVAVDAPPMSYLLNLEFASELGITSEQIEGVLTAIAPIVGTTRIVAATGAIAEALGIAIVVGEMEDTEDDE
jgi:alkylhydroperoxidase/carboxymuconolactone decarboxylase family protein YurZ